MEAHCEVCNIFLHRNSLAKHRRSGRHTKSLERIERDKLLEEEFIDDHVILHKNFFPESQWRRPRFVDNFRLTDVFKIR